MPLSHFGTSLKILRSTHRTLHTEPFTNTQFRFLVIVESAIIHAPNYLLHDSSTMLLSQPDENSFVLDSLGSVPYLWANLCGETM